MVIRQEENTPIGDYFHDSGITKVFEKIANTVDEFEVDTDDLNSLCDSLVTLAKGLKGQIKKVESDWQKHKQMQRVRDSFCGDV